MFFLFKGSPAISTIDVVTYCLRVAVSLRQPLPADDQGAAHRGTHLALIHSQSDHAESEQMCQARGAKCSIRTKRAGSGCATCTTRVCSSGATVCTTASSGETGSRPPTLTPTTANIRGLRVPRALQEQPLERPRLHRPRQQYRGARLSVCQRRAEVDCACHCDVCEIYSDPHSDTFDGLEHHYQGYCEYSTPCDGDHAAVPFEVVGIHEPCLNGVSAFRRSMSSYTPP